MKLTREERKEILRGSRKPLRRSAKPDTKAGENFIVPSPAQRHTIAYWSDLAGIELPEVRWRREATDVLNRLDTIVHQPTLGRM